MLFLFVLSDWKHARLRTPDVLVQQRQQPETATISNQPNQRRQGLGPRTPARRPEEPSLRPVGALLPVQVSTLRGRRLRRRPRARRPAPGREGVGADSAVRPPRRGRLALRSAFSNVFEQQEQQQRQHQPGRPPQRLSIRIWSYLCHIVAACPANEHGYNVSTVLSKGELIDTIHYTCDNRRFWLSTHNCQCPTPTSKYLELELQIRIFGADQLINCLQDWKPQFLIWTFIYQKRRILRSWGCGLTTHAG